ncbi:50S ribosomal protein L23, partial [Patescibacteria group bacterium]|nr:50S ribosomal protein L23 [Patescibacteria group bacterium]
MPNLTLLKPLITEKTMRLAQAGQFTFNVAIAAAKGAIAQTVATQFKVNVVKVTTLGVTGKTRRTGKRRLASKLPERKKAVVTLKAGQMIDYFKLPEKDE